MGPGTLVWATAAGLAAGSTLLALLVWVTERRFRAEARDIAPAVVTPPPGRPEPMTSLRVVYVHADAEVVTVDALIDEPGTGQLGATGMPVALRLQRADTPWFDETTCRMLEQWAEDCRVVQVAVRRREHRTPTATLRSGPSMMKLSLIG